ncbi:MAG: hypothetical protein JEZ07_04195 [Phycisphaerae bacterium]|nr:hypothetical protein [Phycisphaerae bacterium]
MKAINGEKMKLLGLILTAVSLILSAWVIQQCSLWSHVSNQTIPWFASAIAISMLIVGATCLLSGNSLAKLPFKIAAITWAVISIVSGAGIFVDNQTYGNQMYQPKTSSLLGQAVFWEWLGFIVILAGCYCLTTKKRKKKV